MEDTTGRDFLQPHLHEESCVGRSIGAQFHVKTGASLSIDK